MNPAARKAVHGDEPRGAGDAHRLPGDVAREDAERHRGRERARQKAAADRDAHIREREERHDAIGDPRMEALLKRAQRRRARTTAALERHEGCAHHARERGVHAGLEHEVHDVPLVRLDLVRLEVVPLLVAVCLHENGLAGAG